MRRRVKRHAGAARWRVRESPLRRMDTHEHEVEGARLRVHQLSRLRPTDQDDPDLVTFVLVHGLGVSSEYFVPLAETLAVHGRVVLFDLPGFAGLPHPPQPLTIGEFAAVVRAELDHLEVVNPVLLGHSMGAQVVVELMAADPLYANEALVIGPVVNAYERRLPRLAWRFMQSARHERFSSAAVSVRAFLACGPEWASQILPEMMRYPIEERIGQIPARLVLMTGAYDATSPVRWVRFLAAQAGGAQVVVVPAAAHQVMYDHADRVAEELLSLAGIGTVGAA